MQNENLCLPHYSRIVIIIKIIIKIIILINARNKLFNKFAILTDVIGTPI